MSYLITCPCGKSRPVTPGQADSDIACDCGRLTRVPPLSQLRQAVGEHAYSAGAIGRIHQALAEGTLPAGAECTVCWSPTAEVLNVSIECERVWFKGNPSRASGLSVLWALLFPLFALRRLIGRDLSVQANGPEHGRETVVRTPLRVCKQCQEPLRRASAARQVREMLLAVPVYGQLLDEYPEAVIHV